ncbi:MAG TPA: endonuclease/exonuclease/phosphatase family protein [Roseiflexaceae bacterium]|nr:endonuclease/exonuclease/phosphatase family protein [Roseiflexaceae bacterium]
MQALRRTTRWLMIGATLIYTIGLFALAALWASAEPRPWWLAIANVFALLLFAPLLLCIPAALVVRSWWMRGAVAAALMLFLALFGAHFLPRSAPPANGTPIRVMTFNQLFTNQRTGDIIRQIRAQNADVVGLQEFSEQTAEAFKTELIGEYPYQFLEPGNQNGLGLISRYPFLTTGPDESRHGQSVTIQLEGQTVTIMNLHLTAPYVQSHKSRKLFSLPVITDYDTSAPNRQIDRLLAGIEKIDGPLLIMGDFNTSDREPHYAKLDAVLHDAFRETNWGLGFTFPNHKRFGPITLPFPLIRIDYVWSKGGVSPTAAHVECDNTGADHCLLVTDLRVEAEAASR